MKIAMVSVTLNAVNPMMNYLKEKEPQVDMIVLEEAYLGAVSGQRTYDRSCRRVYKSGQCGNSGSEQRIDKM